VVGSSVFLFFFFFFERKHVFFFERNLQSVQEAE